MSKATDAVAWATARIGNPYIYGATGQTCTPSYREARYEQYPEQKNNIINNCPVLRGDQSSCSGCKWDGLAAYDCAQFTRYCMKSVGITLVSGSTSQWNKTTWAVKGEIANLPTDKVCLVFRQDSDTVMGHVGLYCGDGYVIHAKGHAYGVVKDLRSSGKWTHYGIPAGLYDDADVPEDEGGTGTIQNLPSGIYYHSNGYYYGNNYLTEAIMQVNALYITKELRAKGWSYQAIAAVLGNMESESNINPGLWQSKKANNLSGGYGLTQWTPARKYTQWVDSNGLGEYWNMDNQLRRLHEEFTLEGNPHDQYYPTTAYPETRSEFYTSTKDPAYLARAFVRNYERPASILYGDDAQKQSVYNKRGNDAEKWYQYITTNEWTGGGGEGWEEEEPDQPITITFDLTLWLATRRAKIVVR